MAKKARAKATPRSRKANSRIVESPGLSVREIDDLRAELARLQSVAKPSRWNANQDDVRKSVAKLVLTLVEFIRRVLERQAIRRHEAGTLTPAETEAVGMALMRLEETIAEMAATFGLDPKDLNLELGPLGKLY
ncbi:MAG TPA: gas vesicle protein K [Vicinamibacterales bacterium]|nr:gas vesicle protein K [Vicinamibacterales bacterium]